MYESSRLACIRCSAWLHTQSCCTHEAICIVAFRRGFVVVASFSNCFLCKKAKKINIRVSKSVQNSKKLKIFEKKEMFYAF